jgi:hypothetical protein
MIAAGRWPPLLDKNVRWRNMDHNIGRSGTEGQTARKNQSDHSAKNHTFSFTARFPGRQLLIRLAPEALPGSSSPHGVIENQQHRGADYCHEKTVQVQPAHARGAKDVEQPPAGEGADDTQQDVEQHAFPSPVYQLAADVSGNQAENDPSQE